MQSFQALTVCAVGLALAMIALGLLQDGPGGRAPDAAAAAATERAGSRGGAAVTLRRGADGHFRARARLDGKTVEMLVDTGATDVVLPYRTARALGLLRGGARFDQPVSTANGVARFARIRLRHVDVGGLLIREVPALVAPEGALAAPLLGMSYLGRLKVSFDGARMRLSR